MSLAIAKFRLIQRIHLCWNKAPAWRKSDFSFFISDVRLSPSRRVVKLRNRGLALLTRNQINVGAGAAFGAAIKAEETPTHN
jgi:hypothetical protein